MLLAPHIIVGAAIAAHSPNLLIGVTLAFISHFALDAIPHWEYSAKALERIGEKYTKDPKTGYLKKRRLGYYMPIFRRIAIDVSLGFLISGIASALSKSSIPFVFWAFGGFFGVLPDGLAFILFLKPKNKILKLVYAIHKKLHYDKEKKGVPPLRMGLATQAIVVLLSIYFLVW